jgi:hypothetical protein
VYKDFLQERHELKRFFLFAHDDQSAEPTVNDHWLQDKIPQQFSTLRNVRVFILNLFFDVHHCLPLFVCSPKSDVNVITVRAEFLTAGFRSPRYPL